MKTINLPQAGEQAPEKPRVGEPCNGCGYCCASEVCGIGKMVFGNENPAPCPAMNFHDGRFWCGVVEAEKKSGLPLIVAMSLGIGRGCDSYDPHPDPILGREMKQ